MGTVIFGPYYCLARQIETRVPGLFSMLGPLSKGIVSNKLPIELCRRHELFRGNSRECTNRLAFQLLSRFLKKM
jgi:hypothetical protein